MQPSLAAEPSLTQNSDTERRLQTEQLMIFCRLAPASIVSGILAGLFVGYVLLRDYSVYQVLAWYGLLLVIVGIRGLYLRRILRGHIAVDKSTIRKVLTIIALDGLVWCIPSTTMIPSAPSNQVILSLFLVGISANRLISLTPLRHAYTIFVGAMMLPIAALYFWIGGDYATSAIGIFAYFVVMMLGGKIQTQGTENLIRLQLDNAALAAKVQREKEVVEHANRDLQQQVEQRERTEAALRISKGEAEAANCAKNQFLAKMSHELRTPLNGILGTSELLLRSLPSMGQLGKHIKYAQTIRGAGERLLHLINDILDMARIEAGAVRIEEANFMPRDLVGEVVDLVAKQCSDKGLALSVNISAQVPAMLRSDPNRIRQIVANLVSNAVKFTDRGGIEIRIEQATAPEIPPDANHIVLRWSVIDSGIGIADQAQKRLFQPFSQVDDSSTRKFGGSGLGLAICQQLVRAMHGRMDVEATVGKGSAFWFELPFTPVTQVHAQPPTVPAAVAPELTARILIAEDNFTNSQLVMEMLELAGCAGIVASNGREALAQLERDRFDLVLMDWHMPEMDGVAATRAWRAREDKNPAHPHIPIVALTASVLPGDRDTCMQAGMDDFIAKPFTYDELIAVVQRWLPQRALQTELSTSN